MIKDIENTKDTKDTVCLFDKKNVSISHMRIEVQSKPRDSAFLRMDSWECNKSQNCKNMDCLGKSRNGKIRNWA